MFQTREEITRDDPDEDAAGEAPEALDRLVGRDSGRKLVPPNFDPTKYAVESLNRVDPA